MSISIKFDTIELLTIFSYIDKANVILNFMNQGLNNHLVKVKKGLKALDRIFNKQNIDYRVLGSLLVAALNERPHRKLGDIDILIDKRDIDKVINKLKSEGYGIFNKKKVGFQWQEAHRVDALGFTFLLVGDFKKNHFSYRLSKNIELRISNSYLKLTKYSLLGNSFRGIPIRSIYEGLKISSLNPKRSIDNTVIKKAINNHIPDGISLESVFKIYIMNIKIPYAYSLFSWLYNLYGGLRVIMGKKYEIWD